MKIIVTLHPFAAVGGGEIYTANVWKALVLHDPSWRLLVPLCKAPGRLGPETPMLEYSTDASRSTRITVVSLGSLLLDALPQATHLWLHQFAADAFVYDLCWAAGNDARLLLTNLGCEPLAEEFAEVCGNWPKLQAIEISEYAAKRSNILRLPTSVVTAGVWQHELCDAVPPKKPCKLVAVGRVLPHKGFDVTIAAMSAEDSLTIIGSLSHDLKYCDHLAGHAAGKTIDFAGGMSQDSKNECISQSRFLVASSTHRGYDGTKYAQVELLGLVIMEAVARGTLPITSDIPPFMEIMLKLGLADLTYPEGDPAALRALLDRTRAMPQDEYESRWKLAREGLCANYLWDSFAQRLDETIDSLAL